MGTANNMSKLCQRLTWKQTYQGLVIWFIHGLICFGPWSDSDHDRVPDYLDTNDAAHGLLLSADASCNSIVGSANTVARRVSKLRFMKLGRKRGSHREWFIG
jgi:hypothetical protein